MRSKTGDGREPVGDEAGANRIEEDAQLDPAFAVNPVRAPNIDRPRRILLTGAGGFLGAYLLRELLVQTDAEILCLMRASTREAARDRIAQNLSVYGLDLTLAAGRISPVPGDLSLPLLGLEASEFEQLAGSIDAIYHAAAEVNFLQPYAALRSTNIGGTNEILKLSARTTTKALHYVSTLGVLGMAQGDGAAYLEQDVPDRYDGPEVGYFQSKWVAERLVLQARTRGLPATIYRPGVVAGDSRSGAGSATDLLGSMMRTLLKMGVAPESDAALDMVPVDFVAAAIVRISRQPNLAANVFHLTNPAPARFSDVARWIGGAGHRLHTVPLGEWIDAFRAEAMSRSDGASTAVLPSLVQSLLLEAARLAPGASGVIRGAALRLPPDAGRTCGDRHHVPAGRCRAHRDLPARMDCVGRRPLGCPDLDSTRTFGPARPVRRQQADAPVPGMMGRRRQRRRLGSRRPGPYQLRRSEVRKRRA